MSAGSRTARSRCGTRSLTEGPWPSSFRRGGRCLLKVPHTPLSPEAADLIGVLVVSDIFDPLELVEHAPHNHAVTSFDSI